jgi:hypothetical protein
MSDLKNFRGPLPLDDSDFAAIRAKVMAKIDAPLPRFVFAWRFAFAASVIAVLSVLIGRQPAVAPAPGKPRILVTAAPTPPLQPQPAPVAVKVAPEPLEHLPARAHISPIKATRQPVEVAAARIEIQTSDPDVRIIWISNSDSR